jgi:serine/threonine protein phosphatase PrpC
MLRVTEHFERTDTGRERRVNEDSYFARAPVFVVADGMGGAQAGEVASRMAVELFEPDMTDEGETPEQLLAERAREANRRIYELARSDAHRAGMGTTMTAAYVGEQEVSIAHVGDSRAYRWRDGKLEQLTNDHSLVAELERQGKLTAAEAEDHPQRSIITRALGPEPYVEVDTRSFTARPGDVYLLCSDGLTSMIAEDRVEDILRSHDSLGDAGRALIAAANESGGRDNITVILFRVDQAGPGEADQPTIVGMSAPDAGTVAQAEGSGPEPPPAEVPADGDETDRDKTVVVPVVAPDETDRARTVVVPRPPRAHGTTRRTSSSAGPASTDRRASQRPSRPGVPARRRRRWVTPLLVTVVVLGMVLAGAWLAVRSVYFVGTNSQGLVTVFRGVPYELPAGIDLYSTSFVSGVAAAALPPARRETLLDHKLRSRDDAADLVRRLELGELDTP